MACILNFFLCISILKLYICSQPCFYYSFPVCLCLYNLLKSIAKHLHSQLGSYHFYDLEWSHFFQPKLCISFTSLLLADASETTLTIHHCYILHVPSLLTNSYTRMLMSMKTKKSSRAILPDYFPNFPYSLYCSLLSIIYVIFCDSLPISFLIWRFFPLLFLFLSI